MSYDRFRDWLEEALDDYNTAQDLYRLGRYSKACFFSHQACEKILKALMIKKLGRYEPIHSVAELLRRISGIIDIPRELVEKAEKLDRFYIPTRYPNAWPWGPPYKHYDENDAKTALEYAREVIEFARREIEKDP
ncbi:MAG: HEPN domain-containing protein [Thermoprotei archaeon]